jgi:hypothetical protein
LPPKDGAGHRPSVWIEVGGGGKDGADDPRIPHGGEADGVVYVVPGSPGEWSRSVDVGAGTFRLGAPLFLPPIVRSPDLAQIRAIYNEAVDARTVDVTLDRERTNLSTGGRIRPGYGLGEVGLLQIVVERADGRVFVQDLDIGLDYQVTR